MKPIRKQYQPINWPPVRDRSNLNRKCVDRRQAAGLLNFPSLFWGEGSFGPTVGRDNRRISNVNMSPHDPDPQNRNFATTRWSLVASAAKESSADAKAALQLLCQIYWLPLYVFARKKTQSVVEAQDLTQSFFVELLEKDFVANAQPGRGKFRSYLLTSFKHYMSKEWAKAKAQKRGGGKVALSLDFKTANSSVSLNPESGLTAEQIFDQQWAIALLDRVLNLLKDEFEQAGNSDRFDVLKGYVIGEHSGMTYEKAAAALGINEAAAKKAASRMRTRYKQLMRAEIAETVTHPSEIDDEIRSLFTVLQQ